MPPRSDTSKPARSDSKPRLRQLPLANIQSVCARRPAQFLGPFGVSLICHGIVVLLLLFTTWAVHSSESPILTEYEAKIVSEPKGLGPVGGFRFPGRAYIDRPDSARAGHESPEIQNLASLLAQEEAFQPRQITARGSGIETVAVQELSRGDIVGISSGSGGGPGSGGLGSGLGDRELAGGGPVGSMWGVGEGQHGESVVYVMDRSGSMGEVFSLLKSELKRAIGALDSDQSFDVIWFNEGPADDLFGELRLATIDAKREAFGAIDDVIDSGQTEPLDAIRRGLAYRPDVLFLLSDGDFGENNNRILRVIESKNENKSTTINTILFVYDVMGEGERVLRAIAEANNGTYKHVTEEDLRR